MSLPYDPVPPDVTELIAAGKPAYPHEARALAREVLELRKRVQQPSPQLEAFNPWGLIP